MRDCVPLLPPHSRVSGKACARQLCRRRRGCTAAPCFFPEIASALCRRRAAARAAEQGMDTPIDLPALECAARTLAPQRSENYYLPPKEQRIAVLGASLPGCAFAARMAEKQYLVTVFESSDRICPELDTQLSRSIIEADILPALQKGPCTLEFGTPIDPDGDYVGAFDLVYVPSGTTYRPKPKNVLRGRCGETVSAFAGALADVADAEWFLRTGEQKKDAPAPLLVLPPTTEGAREIAALDKAAARQEAVRCKKCDCSACVDHWHPASAVWCRSHQARKRRRARPECFPGDAGARRDAADRLLHRLRALQRGLPAGHRHRKIPARGEDGASVKASAPARAPRILAAGYGVFQR